MTEASLTMDAKAQVTAKPHLPDAQTVTAVTHWTDRLFSFRVTRPRSLPRGIDVTRWRPCE